MKCQGEGGGVNSINQQTCIVYNNNNNTIGKKGNKEIGKNTTHLHCPTRVKLFELGSGKEQPCNIKINKIISIFSFSLRLNLNIINGEEGRHTHTHTHTHTVNNC